METTFARELIENPGPATTRQLFAQRHPGIFWVDWREADDEIVRLAAAALARTDLRPSHEGGKLFIDCGGRRTEVPLEHKPGEQDVTLASLNRALHPYFEIRYVKASEGGDTAAFQALPAASWRELEASFGARVSQAFPRLDSQAPLFAREELPANFLAGVHKQLGPVHFARVALRVISAERATQLVSDPARTGDAMPYVDGLGGDLAMTYFHDLIGGDHADITEGELRQYGTSAEEMRGQALQNTEASWSGLAYFTREGLKKVVTRDELVASTVALCDGMWTELSRKDGPLLAAFPHRDVVLFGRAGDSDAVGAMLEAIDAFHAAGAGLSRVLHAWGPDGWRAHPAGEADRTFRKSFNWRQAELGNLRAQFEVAMTYQFMEAYEEAVKWYYKAAVKAAMQPRTSDDMYENGSACQCNLADKYEHGLGTPQDLRKALYWYGKSAAMGNEVAQYSLGMMYLQGRGVEQNLDQARDWLRQSAARGYADAVTALRTAGTGPGSGRA